MSDPRRASAPRRDELVERALLAGVELETAGAVGFADRVALRLAEGQRLYGDRWATCGLASLVGEMHEEAWDLAAWGLLARQALERDPDLSADSREIIRGALDAVIRNGAIAHSVLRIALRHIAPHLDPDPDPPRSRATPKRVAGAVSATRQSR